MRPLPLGTLISKVSRNERTTGVTIEAEDSSMTSVALVSFLKVVSLLGSMLMVLQLYRTGLYRQLSNLFCLLHFPHPQQHLAVFRGRLVRPLPASLGSDRAD